MMVGYLRSRGCRRGTGRGGGEGKGCGGVRAIGRLCRVL